MELLAAGRHALRPREHQHRPPRQPGAARARALPADKDYIVRDGEVILIDEFTGRMMTGPAAVARACTRRSRPRRASAIQPENVTLASRHLPELLPPLREARRHDRHRRHRGRRVRRDLQARRGRGADQHAGDPQGRRRPGLPHRRARSTRRSSRRSRRAHEAGQPILVGTTSIEKSEQLSEMLKSVQDPAQRAERPLPRAGGRDRRRGRRPRRGDHRHQHGRPRHRHPARRQRRDAGDRGAGGRRAGGRARRRRGDPPRRSRPRSPTPRRGCWRPAGSTCSPPSATRAGASTTSSAAAPAARATRAAPTSTSASRTT